MVRHRHRPHPHHFGNYLGRRYRKPARRIHPRHPIRRPIIPGRPLLKFATGFAPLAIFATTVLVASGVVSSLMQVTIPEAINSPYGRVLGAIILLLSLLIAQAIKNNRSVAKSSRTESPDARKLIRYIGIELTVTVLLATAGLANLEPARQYAERTGGGVADYVSHSQTIDGAEIGFNLEPGKTGTNALTVNIQHTDGSPFGRRPMQNPPP